MIQATTKRPLMGQTMTFDAEDMIVAAIWSKAEALYAKQLAILARYYKLDQDERAWRELGLDCRLAWWDQALVEMRLENAGCADYAKAGAL